MGKFDNCLLACDIDGTLVANDYINPKNVEKIEYFMSEGGKFSVSTGRSVCAISVVLNNLKRISPSVLANGCIIYDYNKEQIVYDNVIPFDDHYLVEKIINSGINVGVEVHSGAQAYTVNRTELVTEHHIYEKYNSPDTLFKDATKIKWNKVICMLDSAEDRTKLREYMLKDNNSTCDFVDTCAIINGQLRNYFEIVPKGVSKASSLKKLCEIMNIKDGGLFAIGDYYNDIEMLQLADISAVPCDSPEEIKALAQYITTTCENGAVADFIDYLIKNT
ncbi:MAG: HAD family hydrolase [Clostridia bacterium]|nr:HAD family hydrolase [Clostridia bacterium]